MSKNRRRVSLKKKKKKKRHSVPLATLNLPTSVHLYQAAMCSFDTACSSDPPDEKDKKKRKEKPTPIDIDSPIITKTGPKSNDTEESYGSNGSSDSYDRKRNGEKSFYYHTSSSQSDCSSDQENIDDEDSYAKKVTSFYVPDKRSTITRQESEKLNLRDLEIGTLSKTQNGEVSFKRPRITKKKAVKKIAQESQNIMKSDHLSFFKANHCSFDNNASIYDMTIDQLKNRLRKVGVDPGMTFAQKLSVNYNNKVLWLFHSSCFLRKWAIYVIETKFFDNFILAMIMMNCFFLALYNPIDVDAVGNRVLLVSEYIFQGIFTLEMLLKIFAMGFLHKNGYIRDWWNVMDFLIVVGGLASLVLNETNLNTASSSGIFTTLRAIRVLRPLRSISKFPQIRLIVNSLLKSVRMLWNTLVLYLFFICLFGIVGMQIFQGLYHSRCVESSYEYGLNNESSIPHAVVYDPYISESVINENVSFSYQEGPYLCGKYGSACPFNYTCMAHSKFENPYFGFVSFDNFFNSLLTLFTSISMEGWIDVYYASWSTAGWFISTVFFVLVVVIGNYFIVNLTLVIIAESYNANAKQEEENTKIKKILSRKMSKLNEDEHQKSVSTKIQAFFIRIYDYFLFVYFKLLEKRPKWWVRGQGILKIFVNNFIFNTIFIFLTIINTTIMAIDSPELERSSTFEEVMQYVNLFFIIAFTIESALKIVALGADFFKDLFNLFDLAIIVVSWVDMGLSLGGLGNASGAQVFTVLRAFRLLRGLRSLRVLKLIKASTGIQKLLKVVVKSALSAFYLTILLFILVFIANLLGMRFFGGLVVDNEQEIRVRQSFDSFWEGMVTSFQIITGENWNLIMYKFSTTKEGIYYFPFFIILYIIGNYLVLNLFVAVLFDQFQRQSNVTQINEDDNDQLITRVKGISQQIVNFWKRKTRIVPLVEIQKLEEEGKQFVVQKREILPQCELFFPKITDGEIFDPMVSSNLGEIVVENPEVVNRKKELRERMEAIKEERKKKIFCCLPKVVRDAIYKRLTGDYSLFIFPNNWLRKFLLLISTNKVTELFLMVCIIVATVAIALEDPFLPPDSIFSLIIYYLNIVLTVLFTLELVVKVIAMGFLFQHGAYLRDGWNVLDAFIVIIGLIGLVDSNDEFSDLYFLRILKALKFLRTLKFLKTLRVFKTFRILRTLRPLRFLNKLEGLRIIVDCLLTSIPSMISVFTLSGLIFVIFGIMGVQLFGSKFKYCSLGKYVHDKGKCLDLGGEWTQTILNFDNLLNALVTLFSLSTLEGWDYIMFDGLDVTEVDSHPEKNAVWYNCFYFIIFIIVGAFFLNNLFVGVLIDRYHDLYKTKGIILLSSKQQKWVDMQKIILSNKPDEKRKIPKNKFRRFLYVVTEHPVFELIIAFCIVSNALTMALEYYGSSYKYNLVLTLINFSFTIIFLIEAIFKLVVFGLKDYFMNGWNVFDIVIVGVSLVTSPITLITLFTDFDSLNTLSFISVFRLLRIVRLLRVIKLAKGIRTLMQTFFMSIFELINVVVLLLLFFFIFSLVGMKMFAKLEYGKFITPFNNFTSVPMGMLALFRISTGEAWPLIMNECMKYLETSIITALIDGKDYLPHTCRKMDSCGVIYSPLFFMLFILMGTFVLSNLFIAVIMQSFNFIIQQQESPVNVQSLNRFLKNWMKHDPELTLYMRKSKLSMFLTNLGEPLGVRKSVGEEEMNRLINGLSLSEYDGKIFYHDVLIQLCKKNFGVKLPDSVQRKFDKNWKKLIPIHHQKIEISQLLAAIKIKYLWRRKVRLKKMRRVMQGETQDWDDFIDDNDLLIRKRHQEKTVSLQDTNVEQISVYDENNFELGRENNRAVLCEDGAYRQRHNLDQSVQSSDSSASEGPGTSDYYPTDDELDKDDEVTAEEFESDADDLVDFDYHGDIRESFLGKSKDKDGSFLLSPLPLEGVTLVESTNVSPTSEGSSEEGSNEEGSGKGVILFS